MAHITDAVRVESDTEVEYTINYNDGSVLVLTVTKEDDFKVVSEHTLRGASKEAAGYQTWQEFIQEADTGLGDWLNG